MTLWKKILLGVISIVSITMPVAHARVFVNFGIGLPLYAPFIRPVSYYSPDYVYAEPGYWDGYREVRVIERPVYRTTRYYSEPTVIDDDSVPLNPRTKEIHEYKK
jgi:hypothetical protein